MEVYKRRFASIIALFLSSSVIMQTAGDDFSDALNKINQVKPNIDYSTFCSETPEGEDKIACRIKDVPSVGFLVCKYPKIDEENCTDIINTEVGNIMALQNANVKTVTISPQPISGVKCGKDPSLNCTGFLERWIDKKTGQFQQVRDHISNGTVDNLINQVKTFTKSGLTTTAADLKNIKNYMEIDPKEDKYRQICDLQGFFLVNGGFRVGDTPLIVNTSKTGVCYDDEPSTTEVLTALDNMIEAFTAISSGGGWKVSALTLNVYLTITIIIIALKCQDFF